MQTKTNALKFSNGLTATALTGSTTVSSEAIHIPHMQGFSFQANYSALSQGVTGSFKLQASNDPKSMNPNLPAENVVNWTDVAGSTVAVNISSGSSSNSMWNVAGAYYDWVRLAFVGTAGSGSVSANIVVKGPR